MNVLQMYLLTLSITLLIIGVWAKWQEKANEARLAKILIEGCTCNLPPGVGYCYYCYLMDMQRYQSLPLK